MLTVRLTYSFVESVEAMYPFYFVRFLGGVLVLAGMFIMAYNVWKTVADADLLTTPIPAVAH